MTLLSLANERQESSGTRSSLWKTASNPGKGLFNRLGSPRTGSSLRQEEIQRLALSICSVGPIIPI